MENVIVKLMKNHIIIIAMIVTEEKLMKIGRNYIENGKCNVKLSCSRNSFQRDLINGPMEIKVSINKRYSTFSLTINDILEWIIYEIKYIVEGGFAKVYLATWFDRWKNDKNGIKIFNN